ncbi:MAG: nitrous oxide reductase family maturation protein NosD [Candidatus Hodarchaeota archaeon]
MRYSKTVLILITFFWLSVRVSSQELPFTPEDQFSTDQAAQSRVNTPTMHQITPHGPIIITNNNEFSLQGFPGSGTIDDPYRIEGFNITASDENSILITDTSAYFCVRSNFLNGLSLAISGIELHMVTHGTIGNNVITEYLGNGIALSLSNNNTIVNNTVTNNNEDGIIFTSSHNNTISNNTVANNNEGGIDIWHSRTNIISNNLVINNQGGIELRWSHRSTLSNNMVTNNSKSGITFANSRNNTIFNNMISNNILNGIFLSSSTNITFLDNTVSNNEKGVQLWGSEAIIILNNTISRNRGYGFSNDGSSRYSKVSWNDFIGNNLEGTSQAYDDGLNNTFDQNYWDDWTEPDANGDGVVDAPYPIDGDAHNQDMRPRTAPKHASSPFLSENIIVGFLLLAIILPVLGIAIWYQKRV